ncbi:MAG: 30S ribosomal protein S27ae [Candidatus Bathyarchaeia archaeon]
MSEEKPKKRARLSSLYEINPQNGEIRLKNKKCPRCGSIMARHQAPVSRWTCGSCNYTEFVAPGRVSRPSPSSQEWKRP